MRAFIAFKGIVIVLIAFATFFILKGKGVDLLQAFPFFIVIVLPLVVLAILAIEFFKHPPDNRELLDHKVLKDNRASLGLKVLRGLWQRLPAATYAYGLGIIGGLMIIGGLIAAAYFFFFFDSSVGVSTQEIFGQTIGGGRVNNSGLMAERQNGIIFSFGVAIVGDAIASFARSRK